MTAATIAGPTSRWRRRGALLVVAVIAALVLTVNLYLAGRSVGLVLEEGGAVDWDQYVEASRRLASGGQLYAVTDTYAYHYSPLLAALFGLLSPVGTLMWRGLHVVAALALPTWPLRVLVVASWPFWYDVETGNVLVFVLLAAAWALKGSRMATGAYLILVLLIPRPLMIPVAVWLIWKRPEWRLPFATALVVHAVAVLALGWAGDWTTAMLAAGEDVAIPSNVGPSRFIGTIPWLVVGVPLAVWLTWKGRVGLASLAASPYWLPYYLLMLALDWIHWRRPPWMPHR